MTSQIGPFSPNTLVKSPLPPKLRAVNLALEDEIPVQKLADVAVRDGDKDVNRPSAERDQETEAYSRGASLLLAARERVLSLAEHRVSILFYTSAYSSQTISGRPSFL